MGTPDFAVAPLAALLEAAYNVVGVVTNPDKPAGRGQKILTSPVKLFAEQKGLPILQPDRFRNEQFLNDLANWKADLQIVVAFKMLPEVVWNMPKYGTINLHASLLPQYRGAAPINHAIMNGEVVTGVTTFLLQKEIDTGDILLQKEVKIVADETAGTLHDKLMKEGAVLIVKTIEKIVSREYRPIPQKEEGTLKLAPKIFKEDCRINWSREGKEIFNFIRGLSPYPAAWTVLNRADKEINLKIYVCSFDQETHCQTLGQIVTDTKNYLKVAVKGGYIAIEQLQQAGKKVMSIEHFLKGFQLTAESKLM